MTHSATRRLRFESFAGGGSMQARFDAGRLTSDGGLVWLAEADRSLNLCEALADCIPEWRRGRVQHSLTSLVRQRIFQITCGYADQNDADTLRSDPVLKLACGRLPESGADLASQPTFSCLENAVDRHACEALAEAAWLAQHHYLRTLAGRQWLYRLLDNHGEPTSLRSPAR